MQFTVSIPQARLANYRALVLYLDLLRITIAGRSSSSSHPCSAAQYEQEELAYDRLVVQLCGRGNEELDHLHGQGFWVGNDSEPYRVYFNGPYNWRAPAGCAATPLGRAVARLASDCFPNQWIHHYLSAHNSERWAKLMMLDSALLTLNTEEAWLEVLSVGA